MLYGNVIVENLTAYLSSHSNTVQPNEYKDSNSFDSYALMGFTHKHRYTNTYVKRDESK